MPSRTSELSPHARLHRPGPGQPEVGHRLFVDLIKRAVAPVVLGTPPH